MIKGGYKIINLKDNDLITGNESGVTIKGIHESIKNNYRKPLLLSGIVIDGVEKIDVFVTFTVADGNLTTSIYEKTLTINSDDLVKIT